MLIRLIIVCLVLLAAIIFAFIASMVILDYELKKQEKERKKEKEKAKKAYEESISMCLKSRQANVCPGVCDKCAWGFDNQEKILEFRGK